MQSVPHAVCVPGQVLPPVPVVPPVPVAPPSPFEQASARNGRPRAKTRTKTRTPAVVILTPIPDGAESDRRARAPAESRARVDSTNLCSSDSPASWRRPQGIRIAQLPPHSRAVAARIALVRGVPAQYSHDSSHRRRRPRVPRSHSGRLSLHERTSAESRRAVCETFAPHATRRLPRRKRNMRGIKSGRAGRCGCPSRRRERGAGLGRGPDGSRAADRRCRTSRDPRSTRDIRCRSPSERRRGCRRFAPPGCSARSGAPSPGRRSIAFG